MLSPSRRKRMAASLAKMFDRLSLYETEALDRDDDDAAEAIATAKIAVGESLCRLAPETFVWSA